MAEQTLKTILKVRHDTAANWSAINPTLRDGEIGYDTTNKKIKIGDGSLSWSGLSFVNDDNIHKGTSSSYLSETAYGRKTFANGITISGTGDNNALILSEGARINGSSNRTVFGFNSDNTGFLMNHPNYKLILRGSTTRPYYLTSGSAVDANTPTLALYSDLANLVDSTSLGTTLAGYVQKVSTTTDNAVARYDGTSGALQNSSVTIADTGSLTIGGTWTSTSADNPYLSMGGYAKLTGNNTGAFTFAPNNVPSFLANTTEFRPISNTANAVDIGSASYAFRYGYFATGIQAAQIYTTGSTIKRISALAASPSTTYTYTLPNATGTIALTSDIPTIPADYVDLSTNQTISGTKTFTSRPALEVERLPNTYQEVEYVQTSGSTYVDTGLPVHMNYKYKVVLQKTTASGQRIWGAFNQSSYNGGLNTSITYSAGESVRWTTSGNSDQQVIITTNNAYDLNKHTYIIDNGEVYYDGVDKGKSAGHSNSGVSNYNAFLGTINPGGTTPSSSFIGKIYSYQVWDNNGDLVQDFVPCVRISDSKAGFYDLVDESFIEPVTGTFAVGNNVEDSQFLVFSDLSDVATSGDYNDLKNKPTIPTDTIDLDNSAGFVTAESLADVATSGSYADLTNKPTIPADTGDLTNNAGFITSSALSGYALSSSLADVATTGEYSDLIGAPTLATVATSGSYNDLSNKPTIPTVNDATLTVKQNNTSVGTFTANASTDVAVNIETPQIMRYI